MTSNPAWTRDELILALDVYFAVDFPQPSNVDAEMQELSDLLNRLPVHADQPHDVTFRNPNGVHMKLSNFLALDPAYEGTGLTRGGRLDAEVWDEFAYDRDRLRSTAQAIRQAVDRLQAEQSTARLLDDDEEFVEGRLLTAVHKRRERNPGAVKRKKESVQAATGQLACEACGFDFEAVYGNLGSGYAECHHVVPLAELAQRTQTRLADLSILCANCHRMIHRSRPMLTVAELAQRVTTEIVDI